MQSDSQKKKLEEAREEAERAYGEAEKLRSEMLAAAAQARTEADAAASAVANATD